MRIQRFSILALTIRNRLIHWFVKPDTKSLHQTRITSADLQLFRQYMINNRNQKPSVNSSIASSNIANT